jgi:carboxylate-amine ligase
LFCGLPLTEPIGGFRFVQTPWYKRLADRLGETRRSALAVGPHIHVGPFEDPDDRLRIANYLSSWQHLFVYLFAGSPYHHGRDTGFQSFRIPVLGRLDSVLHRPHYWTWDEFVAETRRLMTLLGVEFGDDEGDAHRIYDWCRASVRNPTAELRVNDPKLSMVEDELAVYLVYGLASRIVEQLEKGNAPSLPLFGPEAREVALLGAAHWDAFDAVRTLNPLDGQLVSPKQAIDDMVHFVEPALREAGVWERFSSLFEARMASGSPAQRMRNAYERIHAEFRLQRLPGSDYDSAHVANNSRPMSDREARALTAWAIAHGSCSDLTPEGKALADLRAVELRDRFLSEDDGELVDLRAVDVGEQELDTV